MKPKKQISFSRFLSNLKKNGVFDEYGNPMCRWYDLAEYFSDTMTIKLKD